MRKVSSCVILLLSVLLLVFSFASYSQSARVSMSQADYEKLLSLVSELQQINSELQSSIELSQQTIEEYLNEIERIRSDLENLQKIYQESLVKQEYFETQLEGAEALIQQAEESLTNLTNYYEAQLQKEKLSKLTWQLALGSISILEFIALVWLFVKSFFGGSL